MRRMIISIIVSLFFTTLFTPTITEIGRGGQVFYNLPSNANIAELEELNKSSELSFVPLVQTIFVQANFADLPCQYFSWKIIIPQFILFSILSYLFLIRKECFKGDTKKIVSVLALVVIMCVSMCAYIYIVNKTFEELEQGSDERSKMYQKIKEEAIAEITNTYIYLGKINNIDIYGTPVKNDEKIVGYTIEYIKNGEPLVFGIKNFYSDINWGIGENLYDLQKQPQWKDNHIEKVYFTYDHDLQMNMQMDTGECHEFYELPFEVSEFLLSLKKQ